MSTTIYSNGSTIGRLVGNLAGGIIAKFAGFRNAYMVCLVIIILSLIILWRIKPKEQDIISKKK